ncbi:MAG: Maf family protein [Planctomycetota bacterium]
MSDSLPLFDGLPKADIPWGRRLVLASGSPRRRQLLVAAGYEFEILPASDAAECGMCSRETAPELVARYTFRKAADVAKKVTARFSDAMILAADTVASCHGQILGKPVDVDHAREMLTMLSGNPHDVYSGVCLWDAPTSRCTVDVVRTQLVMTPLTPEMLEEHLESMRWEGKAGAFGFQDGNEWLSIVGGGSPSNVVGLPMERLTELLESFDSIAETVDIGGAKYDRLAD